MSLTHGFDLGLPSAFFVPDPPGDVQSLDLLLLASLVSVPYVDGPAQIQDEHITAVHRAPRQLGLEWEYGNGMGVEDGNGMGAEDGNGMGAKDGNGMGAENGNEMGAEDGNGM